MNMRSSQKLSYLYFMMTAMIIGLHSVSVESMGFVGLTVTVNRFLRILFDSATGAFFFFSAFLLYRKERNIKEVLLSKIRTLVIPYLLFNVIAFLYKQVLRNVIVNHALPVVTLRELAEDILLAGANPPLWFMRVLFEFAILYPVIKALASNKKIAGGGILLSILIHFLVGVDVGYSTVFYWLPVYLLGALTGVHYDRAFCEYRAKSTQWCLALVSLAVLIYGASESRYVYYIYRFFAPLLLWVIFDGFSTLPNPKWWVRCTIFYYGTHILVISPVAKVYKLLARTNGIMLILSNALVPLMCISILACLAFLLRKFTPTLWSLLLGNRK